MRTITAMFDSRAEAENARDRLSGAGISPDHVTIYDKSALGEDDRSNIPMAQHSSSFMSHDSNETGRGVSQGQPPAGSANGSAGVHRGILGDFIDDRTGTKVGADVDIADRGMPAERTQPETGTGLWASIKHFFQGDDHVYEEGIRRGGFLLSARVDDGAAESATAILTQDANVDLDERQNSWRLDGWAGSPGGSQAAGLGRIRTYDTTDPLGF